MSALESVAVDVTPDPGDFDLANPEHVASDPMRAAKHAAFMARLATGVAAEARSRGQFGPSIEALSRARRYAESLVVLLGTLQREARGGR